MGNTRTCLGAETEGEDDGIGQYDAETEGEDDGIGHDAETEGEDDGIGQYDVETEGEDDGIDQYDVGNAAMLLIVTYWDRRVCF